MAETSPAKAVQQFIEAHLQGRFAESRGLTLERANLSASLFSNWLFGEGTAGTNAPTADVFLSRKFTQAFHYNITGTTPNGDNQVTVSVIRSSPNILHMYSWALAPKRGAAPYELIDTIDTYLTKVNYPIEESRMHFTLIREAGEWYISAVQDEKFQQLQQQLLIQTPLSASVASPSSSVPSPLAAPPPASPVVTPPVPPAVTPTTPVPTTTTSEDEGRRVADAQFNATMQNFNYGYQPPVTTPPVATPTKAPETEEKPSLLNRMGKLLGLGGKEDDGEILAHITDKRLRQTLDDVRDALARYAGSHDGYVPDRSEIYDWPSLRQVINFYGKKPFPATQSEVGFRFLRYNTDSGRGDYTLLVELVKPQGNMDRVEITPYGVDRAK
jgi:hypothetical protein